MGFRRTYSENKNQSKIIVRIKNLRKIQNESQDQLADAINVSKATIQNIEQGKTSPSIDTAILIAKHYAVSLDYLCGISDDMTMPRNILETLDRYISVKTEVQHMTQSHKIPCIAINKCLFDYLSTLNMAEQFKEKVPGEVVDAWLEKVIQDTLESLQSATHETVKYALLSDRDIASDEVMALIEKSYQESNT